MSASPIAVRRRPGAAAALLTLLALGACVDLAPTYRRPASPVPATLPTTGPEGPATAVAAANPAWREVFIDPRLRSVIERALAGNRDLRLAVANVAAARAQYAVERAGQFPRLAATASAVYGQTPSGVLSGTGAQTGVHNERLYDLGAGVSAWQLDLFGKLRNASRASLEAYFATRQARDAARVTLIGAVATDWLTLGSDRALLAIATETRSSGEASLALTRVRFDAGVASALDVAQAETAAQQARADVARLTTQVAVDRNALDLVVGSPVGDELLPGDIDDPGVVLANLPAGLPSRVLLSRPDVAEAEDQLKGASASIGAARAAFFPDISLTGSGGVTSLALSTLLRSASETWTLAPTVTQPIFDFGANRGNLAAARAQRDAALARYEKAIQTAFREVADSLARRATIDEELEAQQALTDAAARAYALADARYRRGTDSYLTALVAQRTLYAARQSLTAAKLARAVNLAALYASLGGGLN